MKKVKIYNKWIREGESCFIIAEAGINHNGDVRIAKKMIDEAKKAGADCVKFQTFKAKDLSADPKLKYKGKALEKFFKCYEFSNKEWLDIINYCKERKIIFSTTCQNPSDLDFILSLTGLPFIKVGSDDLTNLPLLKYYTKKKKPMIISAGMAYESEIRDAVDVCRKAGSKNITVLHCVSSYPAQAKEVNLARLMAIKEKFNVEIGFSDHTEGIFASLGAVAIGAKVIEKHFTLNKNMPGPDHWFSADPRELKELVVGIKFVEKSLGSPIISPSKKEMKMRKIARRSIVAGTNIRAGEIFSDKNIEFKRPGTGISPKFEKLIIGRPANKNYKKGDLIQKYATKNQK